MPALQVRDFPEGLYKRLKECAAGQHRSVAQQTIVAVEQMLAANGGSGECVCLEANSGGLVAGDCSRADIASGCASVRDAAGVSCLFSSGSLILDFATEAMRADRVRKRRELKERIRATKIELPVGFPDSASMLREARSERDARMSELMSERGPELTRESLLSGFEEGGQ